MSLEHIDELASSLTLARGAWSRRLRAIQSDRRRQSDPISHDSEDRATQRENDETLDALDERGRAQVAAIDAALARIEAGTYGECAACHEPISHARLRAEPAATRCIGCEAARRG